MGILKRWFQKEPEQPRKEPTLMVRQYEAAEGGAYLEIGWRRQRPRIRS